MNEKYRNIYKDVIVQYESFVRTKDKAEERSKARAYKSRRSNNSARTMSGFGTISMNRKG